MEHMALADKYHLEKYLDEASTLMTKKPIKPFLKELKSWSLSTKCAIFEKRLRNIEKFAQNFKAVCLGWDRDLKYLYHKKHGSSCGDFNRCQRHTFSTVFDCGTCRGCAVPIELFNHCKTLNRLFTMATAGCLEF